LSSGCGRRCPSPPRAPRRASRARVAVRRTRFVATAACHFTAEGPGAATPRSRCGAGIRRVHGR
jgi:hypothetical protein